MDDEMMDKISVFVVILTYLVWFWELFIYFRNKLSVYDVDKLNVKNFSGDKTNEETLKKLTFFKLLNTPII
jgi:hypothetical protein